MSFFIRASVCVSSLSLPPSVSLHSSRFTETLSNKVSVSELTFTLLIIFYTCGASHCLVLTARLFWENSTGEPHNMPHVCEEQCLVMFVFSVDTRIRVSLVSLDPEADIQILFLQLGLILRPGIEHKVLNTNIVCQLLFIYYYSVY